MLTLLTTEAKDMPDSSKVLQATILNEYHTHQISRGRRMKRSNAT